MTWALYIYSLDDELLDIQYSPFNCEEISCLSLSLVPFRQRSPPAFFFLQKHSGNSGTHNIGYTLYRKMYIDSPADLTGEKARRREWNLKKMPGIGHSIFLSFSPLLGTNEIRTVYFIWPILSPIYSVRPGLYVVCVCSCPSAVWRTCAYPWYSHGVMNFWSNPPDVGGKVEEEEKAAI